jgi:hypothetical protein
MRQLQLHSLQQSKYPLTPLKQYETTLLWSGNVCYNPVEKKGRRIFANLQMEEIEYPFHLSSIDYVEKVKVVVYSSEPLIWSENDDLFICKSDVDPAKQYKSIVKKRDPKVSM